MDGDFTDEQKLKITESLLRANANARGTEGWDVPDDTFDSLLDNRTELKMRLVGTEELI